MLFTCVICICVAFLEISKLKSGTASIKQFMELNINFSSVINQDFDELSQNLKDNISTVSRELMENYYNLSGVLAENISIVSMELNQNFQLLMGVRREVM